MKAIVLLLALLGLYLPVSFGQDDTPVVDGEAEEINEEKVVVLTKDNFDTVTKENQQTLVRLVFLR